MDEGKPPPPPPTTSWAEGDSARFEQDVVNVCGQKLMAALSVVRQAYADAYRPLYACVYRFAASQLGGDLEAADEVATETMGRGWLRITSFRQEDRPEGAASQRGNVRGWLLRIARNTCVDVARRRGMTVALVGEPTARPGAAKGGHEGGETERQAQRASRRGADRSPDAEELLRCLEELVGRLKPVVQELAEVLPTFPGGRGRPTRSQRLSVAVRDLRVGCDKTLEAFRQA